MTLGLSRLLVYGIRRLAGVTPASVVDVGRVLSVSGVIQGKTLCGPSGSPYLLVASRRRLTLSTTATVGSVRSPSSMWDRLVFHEQ